MAFWMNAKFNSDCEECTRTIDKGGRIVYDPEEKQAFCSECGEGVAGKDPDPNKKPS